MWQRLRKASRGREIRQLPDTSKNGKVSTKLIAVHGALLLVGCGGALSIAFEMVKSQAHVLGWSLEKISRNLGPNPPLRVSSDVNANGPRHEMNGCVPDMTFIRRMTCLVHSGAQRAGKSPIEVPEKLDGVVMQSQQPISLAVSER